MTLQLHWNMPEDYNSLKNRCQTEFLLLCAHIFFEKPRTITGWKGLLYDPKRDGSNDIVTGIYTVRRLLVAINQMGIPCACEFLDPNMPQYYSDLISWGAIGARTTESQVHRQLASGLSCPVGFKNSTSGSVKYPINSIRSCAAPHTFPGINYNGQACIINSKGNPACHLILRGSDSGLIIETWTISTVNYKRMFMNTMVSLLTAR